MKNKIIASCLAAVLLLAGCSNAGNVERKTVMTIGDLEVSNGVYEFYLNSYMGAFSAEEAGEIALDQCKNNYLVVALAHAMGIEFDEKTQQDIADYKQQVVDSYSSDEGGYEGFLKDNNLTDEDIDIIISVSFYGKLLEEKVEDVEYTDEDKKQYFKDKYRRAKHILISADDTMSEEEQEAAKVKAEELL